MAFRRSFHSPAGEFGRRRFLMGALGSGAMLSHASRIFAATEFWNAKDPSTWNDDEIVILTSKSPWVREAIPNIKNADDPTGGSVLGDSSGGRMGTRRTPLKVIVRWESAQPILDALRATIPADFTGHYVVSVTNLPVAPRRAGRGGETTTPEDMLDRIQNGATLEARDKGTAEAGIARRSHIGSILLGFSKEQLVLSPGDREIVFALNTDILTLKAKFDGKEMIYHGKLAV
jgi:hypothetical protein